MLAPSRPTSERLETSDMAWQPQPTGPMYSKSIALNCLVLEPGLSIAATGEANPQGVAINIVGSISGINPLADSAVVRYV